MNSWQRNDQSDDERRFARLPFSGDLHYRYGASETGVAALRDIGRGGFRVQMGRYLRPSTRVLMMLNSSHVSGVELKGEIIWCKPVEGEALFQTGLRVYYDEPGVVEAVSDLIRHAWRGVMLGGVVVPLIQPNATIPHPFLMNKGMQEACGGL
ncbi:MAG: hypothetical protein AMXMBFR84_32090 [Candidatus Hydrogenedentota bacterium]